jgi:two-component system, sensor histidine kinase and response regulator
MTIDARANAVESIETAIAHLADALAELDRMPTGDKTTVGYVAHALNNYVSVSEATLDLLSNALQGHPNPEVTTWLTGLRHLGTMMHHTVGRLVHASTPGDFPFKLEYLNLPTLIRRACDYYRGSAERKQLELVCRPVGEIPLAWADRVAVAVVVDNLLSNAVKFSMPGGTIVVQILPGPGGVVCSVRDQGPGLTSEEQARLFKRGVKLSPVPTAGEPSSGYGLSIAKELIDRMGGRLWSESEIGQGTVFSFRLPYPPAQPAAADREK